jgi:signal peptidase I
MNVHLSGHILRLAGIKNAFPMRFTVHQNSMAPKLCVGDRIFAYPVNHPTQIKRGDIVIFNAPYSSNFHIKRVIGMPDEMVSIKRGKIYIGDKRLTGINSIETDFSENMSYVLNGRYFLLGDNMRESQDSRKYGTIPFEKIRYKAFMIYHPLKRFAFLEPVNLPNIWYNMFHSNDPKKADKI